MPVDNENSDGKLFYINDQGEMIPFESGEISSILFAETLSDDHVKAIAALSTPIEVSGVVNDQIAGARLWALSEGLDIVERSEI